MGELDEKKVGTVQQQASNLGKRERPDLLAMPIVELIARGDLSWAQMEQCAEALRTVLRCHRQMEDERRLFERGEMCQQKRKED